MATDDGPLAVQSFDCGPRCEEAGGGAAAEAELPPGAIDWRAVWQVSSMSLGVGVFAIPYSFLQLGALHGAAWVIILGLFANFAQQRLLDLAALTGATTYEGIAELAFGRAGRKAMSVAVLVTTFIGTLSYLSASRSLIVGVVVAFFLDFDINTGEDGITALSQGQNVVLLIIFAGVVLPRILSRSMGSNAWISAGGVVVVSTAGFLFTVRAILTIAGGCHAPNHCGDPPVLISRSAADAFQYVAVLAFSFSMVFALFPVLEERVQDGDVASAVARMQPAVKIAVGFSSCIYLVVGLTGVFAYGTATQPVALNNPSLKQPITQAVNAMVGTSALLLVAIVCFPVVQSAEELFGSRCPGLSACGRPPSDARTPYLVAVGAIAVLIDTFLPTKVAFALCGALGLASSAYIMPCLLFLRLSGVEGGGEGRRRRPAALKRAGCILVLLFGCVLLLGATPVTVIRLLTEAGGAEKVRLLDLCQCRVEEADEPPAPLPLFLDSDGGW